MILMYDGINALAPGIARAFPNAPKVAGYLNGTYAWSQADWALFPHADHVTISTTASANAGDVLDVEAGDATPDQSAGWIAMRKAAGLFRPTIYCSRSVVPAVRSGSGKFILGRDYDIWVAWYTSDPTVPVPPGQPAASFAAWQYEETPNWDVSRLLDTAWPHRHAVASGPSAPGGMSGTAGEIDDLKWDSAVGKSYHWQLADHGTVVREGNVTATGAVTRVMGISAGTPRPLEWRVMELPGGAWSPWRALAG